MGLDDFLKGLKPQSNDEFEVLTGHYQTVLVGLDPEVNQFNQQEQWSLALQVTQVLDGNGAPGRWLRKRYAKTEKGMRALVNDLFTAGLRVNMNSTSEMEASFEPLLQSVMNVRAWGWTPEADFNGNPLPEAERVTRQQFAFVSEKRVKKLLEKAKEISF